MRAGLGDEVPEALLRSEPNRCVLSSTTVQDPGVNYMPVLETKLNVWTLAAVLTALYTLAGVLKGWWRASLGKRHTLVKGYRRLAPFVRHDYVKALFGEPAWAHKQNVGMHDVDEKERPVQRHVELTVRTWPLGTMGFLVTWCNEDDEVLMYGLTTCSRLLRPTLSVGPYEVRLGRTRLSALPVTQPDDEGPWPELGARRFSYAEQHFFGNPGGYRTWVVGVSDTGVPAEAPIDCSSWGPEELAAYRERAIINSVLVTGSTPIDLSTVMPYGIAPDHDRVRLLELRSPSRIRVSAQCRAVVTEVRSALSRLNRRAGAD
ncbi:ETEC_3214 domain-containing protein [Streptomyces sp. NPDC005336]|uniref:ETEC_3214 domain-containing protein n=1 Tax=Streptomyces sp. NPDC005336 TaxID=3157035 RepID=UPI00339F89D4